MWKKVLLIVVIMANPMTEIYAQVIEDGDWVGRIIHRTGRYMDSVYKVRNSEDGLKITLEVENYGPFEFRDIRVTSDSLSFVWTPSFDLPCTLVRLPDGIYHGVCNDPWGGFGGVIMAPPGSDADHIIIDEATVTNMTGVDLDASEPAPWLLGDSYPLGQTAKIDGTEMNYVDAGSGPVTIVLISGIGDDLTSWELLHQNLASSFRVIAYDRPGLGLSTELTESPSLEQMTNQLYQLLQSADAAPPYLLVTHAAGSWIARQFIDVYEDDIGGVVFIDPHYDGQATMWQAFDADAWESYWNRLKRFQSTLPGGTGLEFNMYASIIDEQTKSEITAVPSVPTVVLTAGRASDSPIWIGDSPEGRKMWGEFHTSWVNQMPMGTHQVLEYGSYIHQESPESIEQAIIDLLSSQ